MSLPPLPPLPGLPLLPSLEMPTCCVCKKGVRRYVDTIAGRFQLCDTCEPPDVIKHEPMVQLPKQGLQFDPKVPVTIIPSVMSLPPLPALTALSAPKASAITYKAYGGAPCPPARILVADPPWAFGDATPHKGAEDHYKVLSIDQICAFPLPPIANDAVLFMWRVGGGNEKDGSLGEQAYQVMRAWGFTPKSELAWIKTGECKVCQGRGYGAPKGLPEAMQEAFAELRVWCEECHGRGYKVKTGMGRYVRGSHEVCYIGTRGKPQFPEDKSIRSVFFAYRNDHSAKPERFYQMVEKLYPTGPYVELFARRRRKGWHCYGDELPTDIDWCRPLKAVVPLTP